MGQAYLRSGQTQAARDTFNRLITEATDPSRPDDYSLAAVRALDELDRVGDLAAQLNELPETIQRIGAMGKLSGSDVETVVKAMNKLNKELATAKGQAAKGKAAKSGRGKKKHK